MASIGFHTKQTICNFEDMECITRILDGVVNKNVQVFLWGPRGHIKNFTDDELDKLGKQCSEANIEIFAHGSYVEAPWRKNAKAVYTICADMRDCARVGATGLVIHLSADTNNESIDWFVKYLTKHCVKRILRSVILYLEISVAKPPHCYNNKDQIYQILREFTKAIAKYKSHLMIGVCIDTAHLFACGTNLTFRDDAAAWFNDFDPGVPTLLHLNDSATPLASYIDRHENLFEGYIWRSFYNGATPLAESGLIYIITWAQKNNVPIILETPPQYISRDIETILSIFQN